MENNMKILYFLLCITTLSIPETSTSAEITAQYSLKNFYESLYVMVNRYYPKASFHMLNNEIHFEYKTRIFIIHGQSHNGEWGNPYEERGPNKEGVLCDIQLLPHKYQGEAVAPQVFDKRYYKSYLMAPYSQKYNCHLYVWLHYPKGVSENFLKEFTDLVNKFEDFLIEKKK
jgi:hypothetical protein